ncbi:MAG: hypothetical protein ACR2N3_02310 [Pyrinomonadaceae bacterium]
MDNTPNNTIEAEKREKMMRAARVTWMIFIAVCAAVILWQLYRWSQGKHGLQRILTPLTFIFIGLSSITCSRNKMLSYILMAAASILVIWNLAMF